MRAHLAELYRVEDEITRYERDVECALRRKPLEPYTVETALNKILASEESARCPHCDGEIEAPHDTEQWEVRNETMTRLAEFVAQDGLEPWKVMRNLYAVFAHIGCAAWSEFVMDEKDLMLGDSERAQFFRIEKLLTAFRRD